LLVLDDALSNLERADARAAHVVELRFFGGLHEQEVAEVLRLTTCRRRCGSTQRQPFASNPHPLECRHATR
jgi:hypothetical protein